MNLRDIPYKKRNQYLAGVSVLFLIIIYLSAISNTISLARSNFLLKERIKKAEAAPLSIKQLERKLEMLDSKLGYYIVDSTKNQEYILEVVSDYCQKKNLTLKEFPEALKAEQDELSVETNKIIAEGSFLNLLSLLYELEQRNKLGRMSSVTFNSYMDNKRKKRILAMTFYLQNIKINTQNEI